MIGPSVSCQNLLCLNKLLFLYSLMKIIINIKRKSTGIRRFRRLFELVEIDVEIESNQDISR